MVYIHGVPKLDYMLNNDAKIVINVICRVGGSKKLLIVLFVMFYIYEKDILKAGRPKKREGIYPNAFYLEPHLDRMCSRKQLNI